MVLFSLNIMVPLERMMFSLNIMVPLERMMFSELAAVALLTIWSDLAWTENLVKICFIESQNEIIFLLIMLIMLSDYVWI